MTHHAVPGVYGPDPCDVPPLGWFCTRQKGHAGPCAAVENIACANPYHEEPPVVDIDAALAGMGERIKARRAALGISLDEVAERAGLTKSHVWELEQGRSRNPTIRSAFAMSQALGMTPAELIGMMLDRSPLSEEAWAIALTVDALVRKAARP